MAENETVYLKKFAGSQDEGDSQEPGAISAGGMPNRNTEWTQEPFTWAVYVGFIGALAVALHMTHLLTLAETMTAVNVLHGVATFSFFHWIKGSPDEFSQGEWNGLTFWEQLDAGLPWTPTKKFLMLVPAILCLIPSVLTDYDPWYLAVNVPVFVVLVVGKLPIMHRVRIMSINTTAGVDDRGAFCGAFSAPAAAVGVGKAGAALGRSKAD